MIAGILPQWNNAGVLPPVRPGTPGSSDDRSPYQIPLLMFLDRFATSPERRMILDGFLRFRKKLHTAGIISGFQWVDGSFLEQIEVLENRSPRDLDVVTFFDIPAGENQRSLFQKTGDLFNRTYLKESCAVDGYFYVLGKPADGPQIKNISYWYSMWSHRRDNGLWKGFVQIDLSPSQDADAHTTLGILGHKEGMPHE